jgi:serine protease Do
MIADELAALASRLREFTVHIRTGRESAGCGIIWSSDGLIVTNAHVIRSDRLVVELAGGEAVNGRVWWHDRRRDLALISIPAQGLRSAQLGDVDALRPGEIVLALGHPFGLPNALAMGVVHQLALGGRRNRWLRADIRLAPGNSGGPLANATGEVVGINTLVAGGLAHAIPVSEVQRFIRETGARAA